ncbi:MAG: ABC transporter substrate-binding protein [Bacteroidota bacterium]
MTMLLLMLAAVLSGTPDGNRPYAYSPQAERLFLRGVEQFTQGRYADARDLFGEILSMSGTTQRTTAAHIMKGKCHYWLGQSLEASRTMREFLAAYPWSSYTSDARLTLGLVSMRIRRYEEALRLFCAAWREAGQAPRAGPLEGHIQEAVEAVARTHLPVTALRSFIEESPAAPERALLWMVLAERELEGGNVAASSVAADTLELRYEGHPYAARLEAVRSGVLLRNRVKLGVLVPLMREAEPSGARQIGTEVYEGIMEAVAEYQEDPGARLEVAAEVRDTERDSAASARYAAELAEDPEVVALVGPVFSHEAAAAAPCANARGIPLVSPTANAGGIAATGPFVFQANPDHETRGRAVARHAVLNEKMRTLAVLAPSTPAGRQAVEGFVSEALGVGARVAAVEWYPRGESDLSRQIASIRRKAVMESAEPRISFAGRMNRRDIARLAGAGVPIRVLDSLLERSAVVPATALLGPGARAILDSLGLDLADVPALADSMGQAARGIQGIFLPISSPEEIGVVASQLVYFNLGARMLGSGEWSDLGELDVHKRYAAGVVFESDSHTEEGDPAYAAFAARYAARTGKPPTRNSLYGYDTARLILGIIRAGASTRQAVAEALRRTAGFRGYHGAVTLTRGRVNSRLHMLRYDGSSLERIAEVDVAEPLGGGERNR